MFKKTKSKLKKWFDEILEAKTSPHAIALGFALGLFIGILPTPGIGILLCLLIVLLFKVNKLSILAGFAMINPATLPFVLAAILWIGTTLTGAKVRTNVDVFSRTEMANMIWPLVVGDLVLAFSSAILSYVIIYLIFSKIYKKDQKKPL
ncbi:MAG: DUF2062 domain-containing protein [Nanoarchaeota archaeon]|nr:DUF2062 domain-containing protein [Nanoarchaeota archaeon]MBU1445172.1 DUF2062 domain-containing protein [Nanoarchaeota archaeon]MBU2406770.1 DUF2062 domain-containing protein [Nanoarchaeota archaeon]MBU2420877.1 DUF2062 domain-containing protein [Nanoarchaeota archaeon]MBU2475348.1 DUF2062 domain-containing protein [Nanoarchaeota archaeon]